MQKPDKYLFEKFFRNECSKREYEEIMQWMKYAGEEESQAILSEFANRVSSQKVKRNTQTKMSFATIRHQVKRQTLRKMYTRVAAVLIIGFISHFSLSYFLTPKGQISIVQNAFKGETQKVILPDGSVVWLNAASSLRYPDEFYNVREVELTGEAFFDVIRNEKKPFIVKSGRMTTRVLGTSFNISAYKNEISHVTVSSGKVKVDVLSANKNKKIKTAILTEGQQIKLNPQLAKVSVQRVDDALYNGWKQGILNFDKLSFEKAIVMLERHYNIRIACQDSTLLNNKIRAKYTNETLNEVLEDLQFIIGFNYTVFEDSIAISK